MKFCKWDKNLEDEEFSGWPLEVDKQLREIIKADPLTTTQEVAKELNINHSTAVWHLKQTGQMKKLDKWMSHELSTNQKTHPLEVSSSFILHNNNNEPFLGQIVTCDGKWTLYGQPWWLAQLLNWEKLQSTSQSQLFGSMLPVWSTTPFWILVKPLHPRSMLSKSMVHLHQKLQHLQPALVNRMVPIMLHDNIHLHVTQPTLQKLNELGYEVWPHPPHSPDFSPTDYHFFKDLNNFCREIMFP